jgi:predicted type IV restriction endonuclease
MKQKIVAAYTITDFRQMLQNAIDMGWKVKIISSNEDGWVAVLES